MKTDVLHFLAAAAALALAAGIVWTVFSVRQAASLTPRLNRRLAALEELRTMRETQGRYEAALTAFEALSNAAPVALPELAAAAAGAAPTIRAVETRPLERGWTIARSEVAFNDINLDRLPAFLRDAESRRPPWRLAECSITASTRADNFVRVVLVMEAIGKPVP